MFNMKNILSGINIRFDMTREKISELQDTVIETIQIETNKKKSPRKRRKMSFSELWDKFN